jgi:hypothetical protein
MLTCFASVQNLKEFSVLKVFNNDNKWTEDSDFANNFWMYELMPSKIVAAVISLDTTVFSHDVTRF